MGIMEAAHPYVPASLELPGFHPALMSQMFILGTYGGASALVVLVVWLLSGAPMWVRKIIFLSGVSVAEDGWYGAGFVATFGGAFGCAAPWWVF
jgi:hypothetical protein